MPEVFSEEKESAVSAEQIRLLSLEELREKKDEMFRVLSEKLEGKPFDSDIVASLAIYSVDDAMELLDRCGLDEMRSIFYNTHVAKEHKNLFKKLGEHAISVSSGMEDRYVGDGLLSIARVIGDAINFPANSELKPPQDVQDLIDSYYAELLRHKEIKHSERPLPNIGPIAPTKAQEHANDLLIQTL
jgi:hypothetical protein